MWVSTGQRRRPKPRNRSGAPNRVCRTTVWNGGIHVKTSYNAVYGPCVRARRGLFKESSRRAYEGFEVIGLLARLSLEKGYRTMVKQMITKIFLGALCCAAVAAAPSAKAADTQLAQASTEVQLRSFMAPVISPNKRAKLEQPITITLVVANSENAFYVCELMPRLRDALLEALYISPIRVSARNVMGVIPVQPALLQAANKALRRPLLTDLRIKQGAKQLLTGSSRSRASSLGCSEVVKKEEKKKKAAKPK